MSVGGPIPRDIRLENPCPAYTATHYAPRHFFIVDVV